jgi:hypothetical protein
VDVGGRTNVLKDLDTRRDLPIWAQSVYVEVAIVLIMLKQYKTRPIRLALIDFR